MMMRHHKHLAWSGPTVLREFARRRGFTLIEFMVVIAIVGVLLALAAPSMRDMIAMRRLRAINAQLVTDLQFARSEAIARQAHGRIDFNLDPALAVTCYTIYTATSSLLGCDCNLGPGAACSGNPNAVEIRTVQVPKTSLTLLSIPTDQLWTGWAVGFEPVMGGLVKLPVDTDPESLTAFNLDTKIDTARSMRIRVLQSGRLTVCAPTGSKIDVKSCNP